MPTIHARVTDDGYLLAADYINHERWADYWEEGWDEDNPFTVICYNVPHHLAKKIIAQGTSEQFYADGYEAWDALEPYRSRANP